jgi:ABC-2 type transport system permease protein
MKSLKGVWSLVRLALRRDRIRIPVWIVMIVGFTVMTAASFPEIYADAAERQARAQMMSTPVTKVLAGPGHGAENYTFGAMMGNEMFPFAAVFVALMSVFMVVRHTRAEEATGSAELVRANVVGRHASSAAALIVTGIANVALGAAMALGLGSLGVESITWEGSWLLGASLAAVGFTFMAIALLTSQLSEYSRAASGMAGAALAAFYVVRGVGDAGDGTLSWLSPFGWAQYTKMYVDDRWWPLLIAVGATIMFTTVAAWLSARRDVGAAMVVSKPGRATARASLSSSGGLARRLQRTGVIWWGVGLVLFGMMYGSLAGEAESFIEEASFAEGFFGDVQGAVLVDSFLATIGSMLAMVVAVFGVISILRLRSEESAGRAEPILATATSRASWALSHLSVAMIGGAILLFLSVGALGASAAVTLGNFEVFTNLIGAAAANIPAVWLVTAMAFALFGLLPRATALVWIVPIYAFMAWFLGSLLQLPDWMMNLSPFDHIPLVPVEDLRLLPLVIMISLTTALVAVGLAAFRRRDLIMS